jgi:hypothetical protein
MVACASVCRCQWWDHCIRYSQLDILLVLIIYYVRGSRGRRQDGFLDWFASVGDMAQSSMAIAQMLLQEPDIIELCITVRHRAIQQADRACTLDDVSFAYYEEYHSMRVSGEKDDKE